MSKRLDEIKDRLQLASRVVYHLQGLRSDVSNPRRDMEWLISELERKTKRVERLEEALKRADIEWVLNRTVQLNQVPTMKSEYAKALSEEET